MVVKDDVLEKAKEIKPEAVVTYELCNPGQPNEYYDIKWQWEYKGQNVIHHIFLASMTEAEVLAELQQVIENIKTIEEGLNGALKDIS